MPPVRAKNIKDAENAVQKAVKSLERKEKEIRTLLEKEATVLTDTIFFPQTYNIYDLITYSFEKNIDESITEDKLSPKHVGEHLYGRVTEKEHVEAWAGHAMYAGSGQDSANYVGFNLYFPGGSKNRWFAFHNFIPSQTAGIFQYLLNAANNVTILNHMLDKFTDDKEEQYAARVYGWYLRNVVIFCNYIFALAWTHGYMEEDLVPFDLMEYLDIFWRVGSHSRKLYQLLGYKDQMEVQWHPSLRTPAELLNNVETNEILKLMAEDRLHSTDLLSEKPGNWSSFCINQMRPLWNALREYLDHTTQLTANKPSRKANREIAVLKKRKITVDQPPNRDQDQKQCVTWLMNTHPELEKAWKLVEKKKQKLMELTRKNRTSDEPSNNGHEDNDQENEQSPNQVRGKGKQPQKSTAAIISESAVQTILSEAEASQIMIPSHVERQEDVEMEDLQEANGSEYAVEEMLGISRSSTPDVGAYSPTNENDDAMD